MAPLLNTPQYDMYRNVITEALKSGKTWEAIIREFDEDWLAAVQKLFSYWPELSLASWHEIIAEKRRITEEAVNAEDMAVLSSEDTVLGRENDAEIAVSSQEESNWMLYRRLLERRNWKSPDIKAVENKAVEILRRMKRETDDPVKGLVVGHVQSGKTANMAGLMAIGADNLYNMFIILSGTVENLRKQTQRRLFSDLNHPDFAHSCVWSSLERLAPACRLEDQAQNLDFRETSRNRYMTVSLKNASRLRNLIGWLQSDPDKLRQMRIVIIDDEADQASINTADVNTDERTTINGLIVELTQINALAVNYVSYTATPYANFLNEAWEESLYPSEFIVTLPQPDEHFGSVQLFGLDDRAGYDGLDIVREITAEDVRAVSAIHSGEAGILPPSLENSLAWFLCCSAARRVWQLTSPASMLVHTSRRVAEHDQMARALRVWLEGPQADVVNTCRRIWDAERGRFGMREFTEQFSGYGRLDKIRDYPDFDLIESHIVDLLGEISSIRLDGNDMPEYHRGIHVCIDNSAGNGTNDEMEQTRLLYPPNPLDFSAAFIVIGGNTLSRGLTLEGLVSTFFLRNSGQADTLMQMGRWFGFRQGYELLPRIWMTSSCLEKFVYMTEVEQSLRDELHGYMTPPYTDPSQVAPRIRNSPSLSWLRPTARQRMQLAQPVGYDFSGTNAQTTLFLNDRNLLARNLEMTSDFLENLQGGVRSGDALVWRGVDFEDVAGFLGEFSFHPRARLFGQMEAFLQWSRNCLEETGYTAWNVVAGGINRDENGTWVIGGETINKICRTRLSRRTVGDTVAIGVLRAPQDLLADIDGPHYGHGGDLSNERVVLERRQAGLERTPQLLIYRIARESNVTAASTRRAALDVPVDLIGISLWIPGIRDESGNPNHVRFISVRLPYIPMANETDIN